MKGCKTHSGTEPSNALSSRRVLIAGRLLLGSALRRALEWVSRQRLTITVLDAWTPDDLGRTMDVASVDVPETIIILVADRTRPAEIVRTVQYLRAQIRWYGQFVVVLPTELECQRLLETNIFGLADPWLAFSQVSGHRALALPIMLSEVLAIIEAPEPMDASRWGALEYAGARLPTFRDEVSNALLLARNGSAEQAIYALQRLLPRLADFQWSALLDYHEDERMVRALIQRHEKGAIEDREECVRLLNLLQGVISRTFVGQAI